MTVRITALRRAWYDDLIAQYENPLENPCDVQVGQVFYTDGRTKPDGLCDSAWDTLAPYVLALSRGERGLFDGWMKDPGSVLLSCNDGFRPVSFLAEVAEERDL